MDLHIRQWPQELKRELKAKAALEGRTLREVLIEAAREWIVKTEKKRAKAKR